MIKKILTLVLLTLFLQQGAALADDLSDYAGLDNIWDGQKPITNKEFEDAINVLQSKQKQKEEKQKKKKIKKISGGGNSLHPELAPNIDIKPIETITKKSDGLLINVPVNMIIDDKYLDKGFYKVIATRDKNNDIYFSFYQAQYFKGKIRACETDDDFGKNELEFVELIPYNANFVKIILGSFEFNAYAYVQYKENILEDETLSD